MMAGTVLDPQRRPLEGVEVRLVGDSLHTFTSRTGTFRFYVSRAPEMLLLFRRPGYKALLLKTETEWSGNVVMMPGAFELPDIQVNARNAKPAKFAFTSKYDDFFRRQHLGFGEFITREDIDRRFPYHTPEILEGHPGIRVSSQNGQTTIVAFARCHDYPPKINVYVDGHKLIPQGAAKVASIGAESPFARRSPPDPEIAGIVGEMLERVNPKDIEFIEIFRGPGELPGEFNDGNCGAIVIWTRTGAQ
jgi:hypothetical protein